MKNLANTYLGQYYLTDVIGRGSTSVVYKAFQSSLNRFVAVKVLSANIDPQFEARFSREARAVAQLQHPNILPIYDYGEENGLSYFVMQYVEDSRTLDDSLSDRPVEPLAALRLILPLLAALKYAHERGVVHRDIKPANIMLPRPDWPLLADFGIAKLIDDSQQLTPPGQSVGTAIYMAPERATSTAVDVRTDLYAVGVVLYEMLTGNVPFDGVSPVEVLRKHVQAPVPAPRSINPALPEVVEPVLLRALEKDPRRRYQSAAEMAQSIQRLIGQIERLQAQRQLQHMLQQPAYGGGPADDPYQTLELTETGMTTVRRRNNRLSAGILALALLLAIGGAVVAREARGGTIGDTSDNTAVPTTTAQVAATAVAQAVATAQLETAAPAVSAMPEPVPTTAAIPAPTASPATTSAPTLAPTPTKPAPTAPAATPPVGQAGGATTLRFEDSAWQGGFRPAAGRTYGGRTATWIYGTATEYDTMRAGFELRAQPAGTASLSVEGMDSEGRTKTNISVKVNGFEIYSGPNPLPDDDQPLETGTWTIYTWSFPAELLRPGRNEISVSNLDQGAFSRPPFFMLDYAELTYRSGS
jgi:hypothetical protein